MTLEVSQVCGHVFQDLHLSVTERQSRIFTGVSHPTKQDFRSGLSWNLVAGDSLDPLTKTECQNLAGFKRFANVLKGPKGCYRNDESDVPNIYQS